MTKSFTFGIFLLGILIAQVACSRPPQSKSVPSKSSNGPTEVAGIPYNEPQSAPATSEQPKADDNAPWILPGFDKSQISNLDENGHKCWKNEKYNVCLTKNTSITKLYWKNEKSNVEVQIEISDKRENIVQSWKCPDADVQLSLNDDGSIQQWKFGPSDELQVNRYPDGTSKTKWSGSERPQDVEKSKKFIDSWCENNDFFVGKENCAIYDNTDVNNDPAWILPGFNYKQELRLNKKGRKCWRDVKYYVCLRKNQAGTNLYWNNEKSNTKVEIITSNDDGSILQDWTYQGNHVQISKLKDGSLKQRWQLGSSKLEINKFPGKTAESKWQGPEDPEALKKYQEFIDAWCGSNDFFVKKDDCAIHKI